MAKLIVNIHHHKQYDKCRLYRFWLQIWQIQNPVTLVKCTILNASNAQFYEQSKWNLNRKFTALFAGIGFAFLKMFSTDLVISIYAGDYKDLYKTYGILYKFGDFEIVEYM